MGIVSADNMGTMLRSKTHAAREAKQTETEMRTILDPIDSVRAAPCEIWTTDDGGRDIPADFLLKDGCLWFHPESLQEKTIGEQIESLVKFLANEVGLVAILHRTDAVPPRRTGTVADPKK